MEKYLAEFVGTMLLVLLGDGVVANVCLNRSKGKEGGWIVVTAGWAFGVALAVYAVGRISGAHLNPAVTVALTVLGSFPAREAAPYILMQVLGGFAGATLVWLTYLPHWQLTEDKEAKRGIFCTIPAVRHWPSNFVAEFIGTAVLIFVILAIGDNAQSLNSPGGLDLRVVYSGAVQPLLVGLLVWGIGLSLGGPTGYAINPARDLGPRLAHAILPIPGKGGSDWGYSWVPILGPILGGVCGALAYSVLGF